MTIDEMRAKYPGLVFETSIPYAHDRLGFEHRTIILLGNTEGQAWCHFWMEFEKLSVGAKLAMVRSEPRAEQNPQPPHNWHVRGRFSFHAELPPSVPVVKMCSCGRVAELVVWTLDKTDTYMWAYVCDRCGQSDLGMWANGYSHLDVVERNGMPDAVWYDLIGGKR